MVPIHYACYILKVDELTGEFVDHRSATLAMDSTYTAIEDCRLCHSTEISTVLDLGRQALTGVFPKSERETIPEGPLRLARCDDCGLVQLAHNYQLSMLYGQNYGYRSGLNASMVRHLHGKVQKIQSLVALESGDLVLDIGSNDGTTLAGYTVPGLRRVGMDPTGSKFKQFYADGVELIPDFFSARTLLAYTRNQRPKVVTSIAMFYDLERPLDFVRDVLEVLDDEGLWIFEQSYFPAMVATSSYDTICHEHLEYYALKQIQYIARECGLKIVDVELNDVNGGSFSVTAAKASSSYPESSDRVSLFVTNESIAGYDTCAPLEQLKTNMETHRRDLRALLEDLRREGASVIGYGASTKGNVLLQYCGIDRIMLPSIAEVNPDKFGSFTPGTRIPIISEQEAREKRPDYFLVLPWHFREGIVQKEAAYLESGGQLIFPLPRLEIVQAKEVRTQLAGR